MILLTRFGAIVMVVAVAAQWWAKLDRYHVRHVAICAGLAFLLGLGKTVSYTATITAQ